MPGHAFPLLPGINCTFPQLHDCEDMGKPLVCSKQQVKTFNSQNSDQAKTCDFESIFSNVLKIFFMLYLLTLFSN